MEYKLWNLCSCEAGLETCVLHMLLKEDVKIYLLTQSSLE